MMRRLPLFLILLVLGFSAHAQSVSFGSIATNPSSTPSDTDKTVDETGTVSYMMTYLNVAKYVLGKLSGDCTVNNSTLAITCTRINGLTIPALVANQCLQANSSATAWIMGTCGSGGGGGATTFDQVETGTNVQYTLTCSSSGSNFCEITHTGMGIVDANYTNGTAIASNMATAGNPGVVSTNNSAQWTTQNWLALPPLTYAALTTALTCNSTNQGVVAMVKDSNAAPGSNITAGLGTNKVLALCDGTNWVAH